MRKPIFISILLASGILICSSLFLMPRKYKVEAFKERKGTQYWQLKTGSKIGYTKLETQGSVKKMPILYLHGGPGGKIKNTEIEALDPLRKQGHDLYFYDQIGSGHSARLEDIKEYSVKRHQEDLHEIISEIGAEKVILIGHSWGACLAINYLQHHPEEISKIVLIGPGPILPINRALGNQSPPDSLSLIEPEYSNREGNEKANNWRSKAILNWAYLFHSKLATDKEADGFFTYLNQELSKSKECELKNPEKQEGGGGYYSHIMTLQSIKEVVDGRARLKEMNVPLLILRGQCDNQKWRYTKEYLDLFTHSKLEVIEGAGHSILKHDKEQYLELINQFLSKHLTRKK